MFRWSRDHSSCSFVSGKVIVSMRCRYGLFYFTRHKSYFRVDKPRRFTTAAEPVLVLCPGQGSQHPGMASRLYSEFPEARNIIDRADEALQLPLSRIMFEGDELQLAQTEIAQP